MLSGKWISSPDQKDFCPVCRREAKLKDVMAGFNSFRHAGSGPKQIQNIEAEMRSTKNGKLCRTDAPDDGAARPQAARMKKNCGR
jgi:hypothetical protein